MLDLAPGKLATFQGAPTPPWYLEWQRWMNLEQFIGAMMKFHKQDQQGVVILSAAKDLVPDESDPSLRSG